jgi:hypothetical protein
VTTFGRGLATESSREAEKRLERAKELHLLGDIAFVSELDQARMALDRADQEIFAEKKRLDEEAATRRAIRNALYAAGGLLLLILGFIAWILNRRRRPSLQRAYEAFGKTEPFVRERLDKVEPLLKQGDKALGDEKSLSRKNYTGKTLELGQQLLKQQGQLKEMVGEARQVLKAASGTMHPFSPLAQLSNMVSSGPYEHALNLLSGQSLKLPDELKHLDRVNPIGWIGFAEFTGVSRNLPLRPRKPSSFRPTWNRCRCSSSEMRTLPKRMVCLSCRACSPTCYRAYRQLRTKPKRWSRQTQLGQEKTFCLKPASGSVMSKGSSKRSSRQERKHGLNCWLPKKSSRDWDSALAGCSNVCCS